MKHTILLLLILSLYSKLSGQSFQLQWAANPGMDKRSMATSSAVDAMGNYFVTGFLSGAGNFNTQGGKDLLSATGTGQGAIFLWKLDSAGHEQWARQWNTTGVSEFWGSVVVVDQTGNAYVSGQFSGNFDADPGPNVLMFASDAYGKGHFILKMDPAGNLLWAKNLPGNVRLEDLAVDHVGRLVIAGSFQGPVDLDPGPGVVFMNNYKDSTLSAFVSVWDPTGNFLWARQVESKAHTFAHTVCVDHHDNILVSGDMLGSGGRIEADFDPGPGQFLLNAMFIDAYVWKLDRDGQFLWAVAFSGDDPISGTFTQARGLDIKVDAADDPIVLGAFYQDRVDMDPGSDTMYLRSNGNDDVFLAKLNPSGGLVWAKNVGGLGNDTPSSLALDDSGDIYFTGSFDAVMDSDPGNGTVALKPVGSKGIFLEKFTANGDYISSLSEGGYLATDITNSMSVLTFGNSVFLAGGFEHRMDADPGAGVHDLVSTSDQDIFVQRLTKPCTVYHDMVVSSCGPYTINDSTYNISGKYQQKFVNAAGCDSILNIQLAVKPSPRPVLGPDRSICAGDALKLDPGVFASYRWQDGSTDHLRTVSTAGTYSVTVTDTAGCTASDTLVVKGIVPRPSGFLPGDTAICSYDHLVIRPSKTFQQYAWSDGSTASSLDVQRTGLYWLEATDANGCVGRDSILVGVKDCPLAGFHAPNAFTPNGDGLNDLFRPIIWGTVEGYALRVFDRWGALVYQTTDRYAGWDGKIKGTPAPTGVFTWLCTFSLNGASLRTEKGTVAIIR